MIFKKDLHTHTTFSDGVSTPDEMVASAISMGLETYGISDHSFTFFDSEYCMKPNDIDLYYQKINSLKKEYSDQIVLLCGIEQDYYSPKITLPFDYIIGSVHYVKIKDDYVSVDESAEQILKAAQKHFHGNVYDIVKLYFENVANVFDKTNADIIGHIDLISKHNKNNILFDENNPIYINAWKQTVDNLISSNKPFEINTGAISRGIKSTPYPSLDIYNYIKNKGGSFIPSSDAHSANTICYYFDKLKEYYN